jgi:hypothetical protein
MSVFLSAAFFAASFIVASLMVQLAKKQRRKLRLRGLELTPNCLLTRYPIAFLSGPRTLFRFLDHWNDVPLYLREHGYEVLIIEPSGRTPKERVEATAKALRENGGRCHLIADASLEADMELIAELGIPTLSSLTVVKNPERKVTGLKSASQISIADLKPRRSAIEVFEIGSPLDFEFDRARPSLLELSLRLLLKCHNLALRGRSAAVDAIETAELGLFHSSKQRFKNEERFLNLAVSLAERDLTACEPKT